MDNLPKGLQDILSQITMNNRLTSWRVYGENSIVVTLRFSDSLDNYSQHGDGNTYNQSFRSKPPSAVARDNVRFSEYLGHKLDTPIDADFVTNATNDSMRQQQDSGCLSSTPVQLNKYASLHDVNNPTARKYSVAPISVDPKEACNLQLPSAVGNKHPQIMSNACLQTSGIVACTVTKSTETETPPSTPKASQTTPPKCRKSQTDLQANQFKGIQTLPILKSDVCIQSEHVYSESHATMTEQADSRTVAVSTDPPVSRHIQTYIAHKKDKNVTTRPAPAQHDIGSATKSIQTECAYQFTSTDDVGTEPWMESATQFLLRNETMLSELRMSLHNLTVICHPHQAISGVT